MYLWCTYCVVFYPTLRSTSVLHLRYVNLFWLLLYYLENGGVFRAERRIYTIMSSPHWCLNSINLIYMFWQCFLMHHFFNTSYWKVMITCGRQVHKLQTLMTWNVVRGWVMTTNMIVKGLGNGRHIILTLTCIIFRLKESKENKTTTLACLHACTCRVWCQGFIQQQNLMGRGGSATSEWAYIAC